MPITPRANHATDGLLSIAGGIILIMHMSYNHSLRNAPWLIGWLSLCICVKTRMTYLRPYRVLNANYGDAGEASEDMDLIVPVRLSLGGWEVSVGQTDGSKAFWGHWLNYVFHQIVSVPRFESFGLSVGHQHLAASRNIQTLYDHHIPGQRAVGTMAATANLLLNQDLRGTLAEYSEAAIMVL